MQLIKHSIKDGFGIKTKKKHTHTKKQKTENSSETIINGDAFKFKRVSTKRKKKKF